MVCWVVAGEEGPAVGEGPAEEIARAGLCLASHGKDSGLMECLF